MAQEVTDIKNTTDNIPDIHSDSESSTDMLFSHEMSEEERLEWINYLTEKGAIRDWKRLKKVFEKRKSKRKRTLENIEERKKKLHDIYWEERKKKNLRKRWRKKWRRRRKKLVNERKKMGDRQGYYIVMKMKDGVRYEKVSAHWWMSAAYESFNAISNDYKDNVIGEVLYTKHVDKWTRKKWAEGPHSYDLLLLKKIDPEKEDNVSYIRNDDGKAIKHVINDNDNYVVVESAKWGIPEKYYVYGYDKQRDKKTGKWILDNLIASGVSKQNVSRVFMYGDKLIVQRGLDFDLVLCGGVDECEYLYNSLERYAVKHKMDYVFFTGRVLNSVIPKWIERIQKKTGWIRRSCWPKHSCVEYPIRK